jgi:hypothetical protein
MLKRKYLVISCQTENRNKLQKIFKNPKLNRILEYFCHLHDNDKQICKLYDCNGYQVIEKNKELSYIN